MPNTKCEIRERVRNKTVRIESVHAMYSLNDLRG